MEIEWTILPRGDVAAHWLGVVCDFEPVGVDSDEPGYTTPTAEVAATPPKTRGEFLARPGLDREGRAEIYHPCRFVAKATNIKAHG